MPDKAEPSIPLADMIRALRRDLVAAVAEGESEQVRFALGPIELEMQVEVSSTGGGEAGIKIWVLSLGGKGERASGTSHTVRLSLQPVPTSGAASNEKLIVSDRQAKQPI